MTASDAPIELKASLAIAAGNHIGEAPLWDSARRRLVWVDHAEGEVSIGERRGASWTRSAGFKLGGHVAAALPHAEGGFIVVSAARLETMTETGARVHYKDAPFAAGRMRFNEAKADPQGRIWAGAMASDLGASGAVYCLDGTGSWRAVLEGARLPNGMDWSPDGSIFYFIDSMSQTLDAFECNLETAVLGRRRTLVDFRDLRGSANGMCVDGDGGLWVAVTGASEVRGYRSDGTLTTRIEAPTTGVTSCALGGENGRTLLITSRSGRLPDFARGFGLSEAELECGGEYAGALFTCDIDASGAPATPVSTIVS
jgi:sugar lactone lactonase YvrE